VDLEKLEVAATLPLHAGATFQDRAYRMVIDESTSAEAGQSLRVRTSICSLHVRSTAGTALLLLPAQQTYQPGGRGAGGSGLVAPSPSESVEAFRVLDASQPFWILRKGATDRLSFKRDCPTHAAFCTPAWNMGR
jgi:hypothetical protein